MERILDISICMYEIGPPTLSIMNICTCTKYILKSSFRQNHYPFISFSFHATSRLPSAPALSKELEIKHILPPRYITPSILETELYNTPHHRGAKPKYQVQSHPGGLCIPIVHRFSSHGSSLSSKFSYSSIVRSHLSTANTSSPLHLTNEHQSTFSNLMELCISMVLAKAHLPM